MAAPNNTALIFSKEKVENQNSSEIKNESENTNSLSLEQILKKGKDGFSMAIKTIENCKNFQDSSNEALQSAGNGASAVKRLKKEDNGSYCYEYRRFTKTYLPDEDYATYGIERYVFKIMPSKNEKGFDISFYEIKNNGGMDGYVAINYLEASILKGNEFKLIWKTSDADKDPASFAKLSSMF